MQFPCRIFWGGWNETISRKHLDRLQMRLGRRRMGISVHQSRTYPTFEQTCLHTSKSSSIMLLTNKSKSLKIKYSHPSKSRELEHEVFVRMALEQNIPESQSYIKDHLISFVGLRYGEEGPDASLWDYVKWTNPSRMVSFGQFRLESVQGYYVSSLRRSSSLTGDMWFLSRRFVSLQYSA